MPSVTLLARLMTMLYILVGYMYTPSAMRLDVTVTPSAITEQHGRIITMTCNIRNMNHLDQTPYWLHEIPPSTIRYISAGSQKISPYDTRIDVSAFNFQGHNLNYYLTISGLKNTDGGIYRCVVVDTRTGTVTGEDSTTVTVLNSPYSPLCIPDGKVSVMEGILLKMSCSSEKTESPSSMMLSWTPTINTIPASDGPHDSDWMVVDENINSIEKQLSVTGAHTYNNSKFLCTITSEKDGFEIYGTCIIGPIIVLPVPPEMEISLSLSHTAFPLYDGGIAYFACEVTLSPPVIPGDSLQRYWKTSPQINSSRVFQSENTIQTSILIDVRVHDNGVILMCMVTFRDVNYRANVTLQVIRNATIPGTTIAYPTAATTLLSTRALPQPSNLPWYATPSTILIIAGIAVFLVLIAILFGCLTHLRRRHNREREQEHVQNMSRHPPLNLRPLTTLSENIYNEATEPPTTFSENIYHEAAEPAVLPSNEGLEFLQNSETEEQRYVECGSPQPQLELYAETVENVLYVPLSPQESLDVGYSTVVENSTDSTR